LLPELIRTQILEKGGNMKTTRSWVPLLLSVVVLSVHGAPEAAGQGFSNWTSPVNLGPTINSSAVDG
jgi:uncharacterized membrane protein